MLVKAWRWVDNICWYEKWVGWIQLLLCGILQSSSWLVVGKYAKDTNACKCNLYACCTLCDKMPFSLCRILIGIECVQFIWEGGSSCLQLTRLSVHLSEGCLNSCFFVLAIVAFCFPVCQLSCRWKSHLTWMISRSNTWMKIAMRYYTEVDSTMSLFLRTKILGSFCLSGSGRSFRSYNGVEA